MAQLVIPSRLFNPRCVLGIDENDDFRVFRVGTDGALIVKGEDQLFSYKEQLQVIRSGQILIDVLSIVNGPATSADEVFVVTGYSVYATKACELVEFGIDFHTGAFTVFDARTLYTAGEYITGTCHFYLVDNDKVQCQATNPSDNGTLYLRYCGYKMTEYL